jgi:tetratricopeptide (TPR) repeat protein
MADQRPPRRTNDSRTNRGGTSNNRGDNRGGTSPAAGGARPSSGKPSSGQPSSGKPSSSGSRDTARGDQPYSRPRRDDRTDRRDGNRADRRDGNRADRRDGNRADRRDGHRADRPDRSVEQARYDGPEIEESITGKELDRSVTAQLKGLPEKLAARVARHLVAAGTLLETDPETAYQHTLAARARAARIAVVREACGEAAYAAGHYAEALAELRAAKRMNGAQDYLPVMADCERALGRPDKALTLARNPAVAHLDPDLKAEMTIVEAGARRDLGELDAALRTLENAPLRTKTRADWVVRLRYAYADTLHAAGHTDQAIEWFHRTTAIDNDQITDADHRATQLEHQHNNT